MKNVLFVDDEETLLFILESRFEEYKEQLKKMKGEERDGLLKAIETLEKDIKNLAKKINAGASFIITQMFFKNDFFYAYLEKIKKIGIKVPVSAGIMPVFKAKLLSKMIKLSHATVPSKLISLVEKYRDNDIDMEKAGIEFAVKQIEDLLKHGVDGIHLFTMNRASLAKKISYYSGLR